MLKRWAMIALLVIAGQPLVCAQERSEAFAPSPAPAAPAPSGGNMDAVFPEGEALRAIADPIAFGVEAFSSRLDKIRRSGREPIGLVLAGGSARAYAHIGGLEVLEKAGIRPDFIVANSMGAVVGMLYAAGIAPSTIAEIVGSIPIEFYLDLVLPFRGGFINVDPFVAAVEKIAGNLDLADAKIPIIVTAEDLRTRRQVELSAGDFSRVMATTFAIPAIFEPVPFKEFLLVDGGATNLVPVGIAAEYSSLLIVSTALYSKGMNYGNPISVINRTFDIGKTRAGVKGLLAADPFVIRNRVENISYMQFSSPESIIELGRQSALGTIGDLLRYLPGEAVNLPMAPDFAAARERYRISVPEALADLNRGALPFVSSSVRFKLQCKLADEFEPSPLALGEGGHFGLSAARASGATRSSLSAVLGLPGDGGRQWAIAAGILANPVDALRLSGELRLWGDFLPWPEVFLKPQSVEALAAADWASKGGALVFRPSLSGSLEYFLEEGTFAWATHAALSVDTVCGGSDGDTEALLPFVSARAGAFVDTVSGVLRYGPEWTAKAGLAKAGLGALRVRGAGSFDVSGAGVSLERGDAFRGTAPTGTAPLAAAANAEIVWHSKKFEFDFGEILLVKNIEFGPYFDCAWLAADGSGALPDAFAAGMSLSFTWSFAGLKPFDISLFAGIGGDGALALGIRSNRLFPAMK